MNLKKIIISLVFVFLLSGCTSLDKTNVNEERVFNNTINNTYIFINQSNHLNNYCYDQEVESLTADFNIKKVADEFLLHDLENQTYAKNPKAFKIDEKYPKHCNFELYYDDYQDASDYVDLGEVEVKNKKITLDQLNQKHIFSDFIDRNNNTVNSILVGNIIIAQGASGFIQDEYQVKENGKYKIQAIPTFRMMHFKDKGDLVDYDFLGVYGIDLKFVKV